MVIEYQESEGDIQEEKLREEFFERLGLLEKERRFGLCYCAAHFEGLTKKFKPKFIYHPKCLSPLHSGSETIKKQNAHTISSALSKDILAYLNKFIPVGGLTCTKCEITLCTKLKIERNKVESDRQKEEEERERAMEIDPITSEDDHESDPDCNADDSGIRITPNPSKKSKTNRTEDEVIDPKMLALKELIELNGFTVIFSLFLFYLHNFIGGL